MLRCPEDNLTAEIAILNKEAVALAADSAVTLMQDREENQDRGQKVFTSANKLFALSKYHPVGIMVYGEAGFMGVPWETIVKIYRSKLGETRFDTLEEYALNFIEFLDSGNPLFPEDQQKVYLYGMTANYFELITEGILKRVSATIEERAEVDDARVERITSSVIKKCYDDLQRRETLPSIPEGHTEDIISRYGTIIDEAIQNVFQQLPISATSRNRLREISASLFSKDVFPIEVSGVVIAGFGEEDTFPSLKSFDIDVIVNDKLKYKERLSTQIGFGNSASIFPFAQRAMVATFMEGIDPVLHDATVIYLHDILDSYTENIVDSIEQLDDDERTALRQQLEDINRELLETYQDSLARYTRKHYVDPVIDVVAMLPKDELAAMAESLVSLTSFKLKVTMETETVGGPIDVAIISKGDGFVWIKRKHYFKAELNPQFFANYYRR